MTTIEEFTAEAFEAMRDYSRYIDVSEQAQVFAFGRPVEIALPTYQNLISHPDHLRAHSRLLEVLRRASAAVSAAVMPSAETAIPFQVFRRDAENRLVTLSLLVDASEIAPALRIVHESR